MKDRDYYEQLFSEYPDILTVKQVQQMLGGVGHGTVRKLIQENQLRHYYIRTTYYIPKSWVIDYILSGHYARYKYSLKVRI